MHTNKAPGPDGLTLEYYKALQSHFLPQLTTLLNGIYQKSEHVVNFHESCTTLLLKSNKDPIKVSSYRPISLLNVDYKILTKGSLNRYSHHNPCTSKQISHFDAFESRHWKGIWLYFLVFSINLPMIWRIWRQNSSNFSTSSTPDSLLT